MLGGVSYDKVDDEGLHITVDGEARVLEVDHVIVCAGQEPLKELEVRPALNRLWHYCCTAGCCTDTYTKRLRG